MSAKHLPSQNTWQGNNKPVPIIILITTLIVHKLPLLKFFKNTQIILMDINITKHYYIG